MGKKNKQKNNEKVELPPESYTVVSIEDSDNPDSIPSFSGPIFEEPQIEDMEAILQEANREFFHPLGLRIYMKNGVMNIEKPEEQPMIKYGDDVKQELENVKTVQKMRVINTNKRIKTHGYRVQPVHLPK